MQPILASLLSAQDARSAARDEAILAVPAGHEAHLLDAPLTTAGRADAVYNRFVIEFEPPGSLRPSVMHSATKHAIGQVQQYLRGLANETLIPLDRLAGCAFDGSWIVYVTWERNDWVVSRPRAADSESLTALIDTLASLASGRGLTAGNLDEDFGQSSKSAALVVRALYDLFRSGQVSARGQAMFDQWAIDMGQASGQFSASDLEEWRSLCSTLGVPSSENATRHVLFALQTYFALVAKLVALIILEGATGVPLISKLSSFGDVVAGFRFLESGKLTIPARTANAIEPGIFSWYVNERAPKLDETLTHMVKVTSEYSAEIVEITPLRARDVLKDLYQRLMPRAIRHRLGEYYTPDWLAHRLVNQVAGSEEPLEPTLRVLDPACGSGTFLVEILSRMVTRAVDRDPADALQQITQNVVGFDLSPLAVQAAKVNYLLALAPLLRFADRPVYLPVFLADSVSPPVRGTLFTQDLFVLETSEGEWRIPAALAEANYLPILGALIGEGVEQGRDAGWVTTELMSRVPVGTAGSSRVLDAVSDLYLKIDELHRAGRDGMWWNLLSNAFAPRLHGRFDWVVGNPPWVSWETLPERYRRANEELWLYYGLRSETPNDRRQASANVPLDLSMLFVARCIDRYLVPRGRLGFLITASVFKSELAGRGFRRRKLPPDRTYRFLHIDDMSALAVFEGAANQTAVLVVSKASVSGSWQVPVARWTGPEGGRLTVPTSSTLEQVIAQTQRQRLFAEPVDPGDPASPLLMMPRNALIASRPLRKKSPYLESVRKGIDTRGANGIFFLEVLGHQDGLVRVRNQAGEGRNREVESVVGLVETDVVRRLLRGADVSRGIAEPSGAVLLFHDDQHVSTNLPPEEVRRRFPRAYEYVSQFESGLRRRKSFRNFDPTGSGWLGIYSVTTAVLAEHKVVVREIAEGMVAAAVHGSDLIADHKLYVIPCRTRNEADLLAKVLNSAVVDYMIRSFSVNTSLTGSFLRYIGVRDLMTVRTSNEEDALIASALGLTIDQYRTLDTMARAELPDQRTARRRSAAVQSRIVSGS